MTELHNAALRHAQALIRCPSVTPEEGGALTYLQTTLEEVGFSCQRVIFSDENTPDIDNLYARIGTEAPNLCFAGHTDVVPIGDEAAWNQKPFAGDVVDGRLYGRGTVDMKGGIACFMAAALDYLQVNPDFSGSISFLITGDEEGPAINGTRKVLEWLDEKGEKLDACIVGEPTNANNVGDTIKVGRRGSLTGVLTVNGIQGHVAYPHLADNPVPKIVDLIQAALATPLDEGTEHFQPTNLEFTTVDVGNPATNVIPGVARATFNIRFNDLWSAETLKAELKKRFDTCEHAYEIEYMPALSDVFLTRNDALISPLAEAIESVTSQIPAQTTGGGTSDARFIKNYCPVVEFGLVGQTMHQIDENSTIEAVNNLTDIYRTFLDRYFKG